VGKLSLNAAQPYAKAEGRVFLLVPAYPGCPGTKAVKGLLLLLLLLVDSHSRQCDKPCHVRRIHVIVEVTEIERLNEQLCDAEKVRLKLEYDLEHTHAADSKKTQVISELTDKLKKSEAECRKVSVFSYCRVERDL